MEDSDDHSTASVLINEVGLHARPSVKLTKLAKTFAAEIELALAADGPWVDAKSIVKVMAAKAPKGATLAFPCRGRRRGGCAVRRWSSWSSAISTKDAERWARIVTRSRRIAAGGLPLGPLVLSRRLRHRQRAQRKRRPTEERALMPRSPLARRASPRSHQAGDGEADDILGFPDRLLEDDALTAPALCGDRRRRRRRQAWREAIDCRRSRATSMPTMSISGRARADLADITRSRAAASAG